MADLLRHIGVAVSDLTVSRHFYENLLGFRQVLYIEREGEYITSLTGESCKPVKILVLQKSELKIELLEFNDRQEKQKTPSGLADLGRPHFAINVDDLHAVHKKLKTSGVQFVSEPLDSPDQVIVCFCKDPDGTLIELVEVLSG